MENSQLRLEDIKIDLTPRKVDEKNWNKEQWLKENPINYFKMMAVLLQTDNSQVMLEILKVIIRITRLYLPEVLYKYYSLSDDEILNKKKFDTLEHKKIYMADATEFNDPFDGRGYYYDSMELKEIGPLKDYDGKMIDDFTSFLKSTSLTANGISSMPMWAHYGTNHAGYCVSYDMTDEDNLTLISNTFPIQYIHERVDITGFMKWYASLTIREIEKQSSLGRDNIIITDHSIIYMSLLASGDFNHFSSGHFDQLSSD